MKYSLRLPAPGRSRMLQELSQSMRLIQSVVVAADSKMRVAALKEPLWGNWEARLEVLRTKGTYLIERRKAIRRGCQTSNSTQASPSLLKNDSHATEVWI